MSTAQTPTRTEWLLDRIKRGQFENLGSYSIERLKSLEKDAVRAYEALPASREVDRGRMMLFQGRINLELRKREYAKPSRQGKAASKRKVTRRDCTQLLDKGMKLAKGLPRIDENRRQTLVRAEQMHVISGYLSARNGTKA